MKKLLSVTFCLLTLLSLNTAKAQAYHKEVVEKGCSWDSFKVSKHETKTFKLSQCKQDDFPGWRVRKLIINAEGVRRDAQMEVVVNGDVKGTVYTPGVDPRYIVTVADFATTVQFVGTMGTVKITDIRVQYESTGRILRPRPRTGGYTYGSEINNLASRISVEVINIIDELEGYASYKEYGVFLLPIKKAAARAYASASARGDLSLKVRDSLIRLYNQIVFATDYLSTTFERDNAFEAALTLLELSEEIESKLD